MIKKLDDETKLRHISLGALENSFCSAGGKSSRKNVSKESTLAIRLKPGIKGLLK